MDVGYEQIACFSGNAYFILNMYGQLEVITPVAALITFGASY